MHVCLLARYTNMSTEWLDRVLFATSHRTLESLHDGYFLVENTDPYGDICATICVCGEIFKKSLRETHITNNFWWETRIPSDMCAGKHGPLGICVRETRYPGKHISL